MEETEENTYATKMAGLITTLCRNYEVLLIKQSEASNQLF